MPEALIERPAKLFEAGNYEDRKLNVTEADLDKIVGSFSGDVPVKIEHRDSPLDGFLGAVRSVYRQGKDLMGSIGFTREAWALIDKAGARKLSVGIMRDFSGLAEVSLVKKPRVSGAAVFDDRIEFDGVVEFGFGGMSVSDIRDRISQILNPKTLGPEGEWIRSGPYVYVDSDNLFEDHVVVQMQGRHFNYPFSVGDDGAITLGDPTEVVKDWKPLAPASSSTKASTALMSDPGEEVKPDMPEATKTFSEEDVKRMMSEAADKAKADAEARLEKFSKDLENKDSKIAELMADKTRREAQATVDGLKRAGKLAPAAEPFAMALLTADAAGDVVTFGEGDKEQKLTVKDLFSKVMEAQPKIIKFTEEGEAGDGEAEATFSDEEVAMAKKLGVTVEDMKKYGTR